MFNYHSDMPNGEPQWVDDVARDYENCERKALWRAVGIYLPFAIMIACIVLLRVPSNEIVLMYLGYLFDSAVFILVVVLFASILFRLTEPSPDTVLASYLFKLSHELSPDSKPVDYDSPTRRKRIEEYIKNCENAVDRIDRDIPDELFTIEIKKFLSKLSEIIPHLNEYITKQYQGQYDSIDKHKVFLCIRYLANSIHEDYSKITDEHTQYSNNLIKILKNTEEMPLQISFKDRIGNRWSKSSPDTKGVLKLLSIVLGVGIATCLITYFATGDAITTTMSTVTFSSAVMITAKEFVLRK